MSDDEKAELARQGLKAAELLEPGHISGRVKQSVKDTAKSAALAGLAAMGRIGGAEERSPARARAAAAVDINRALDAFDAGEAAAFEERLRNVAMRKAREDAAKRMNLEVLRRSFPEASSELALLVFNCVDLLEELSDDAEGNPPSAAELARKEELLTRVAELIAPRAGEALVSFVAHVVAISRHARRGS